MEDIENVESRDSTRGLIKPEDIKYMQICVELQPTSMVATVAVHLSWKMGAEGRSNPDATRQPIPSEQNP
jgi:hypothetical protein